MKREGGREYNPDVRNFILCPPGPVEMKGFRGLITHTLELFKRGGGGTEDEL